MSDHALLKPGEKCCCGYEVPKPKPPKPKVNNLQVLASQFCCGMSELGNFNYVDPPDGKKMTHYHKVGGGWSTQQNQDPTTKEDIVQRMGYVDGIGALVCTTGAGQEYLDPILAEIGWDHVFTFVNPGHAKTPVKVWLFSKHKTEK